jgi:predicted  nucleic acid-binding Zn-ribbon protein
MDRLLELQATDSAIDRASARLRELESGSRMGAARSAADEAEAAVGEIRLSIDALAREQQRLEHEIDSLSQKAAAEERRLYDGSIANAKEREETATALRSTMDEVGGDVGRELEGVTEELRTRASDRAALLPEIDPELVQLYEDVRAQKKGVGAAALIDGVCQGCHEKLSAMERDKLKRTEGVKRCEYCRRILIISPSS